VLTRDKKIDHWDVVKMPSGIPDRKPELPEPPPILPPLR